MMVSWFLIHADRYVMSNCKPNEPWNIGHTEKIETFLTPFSKLVKKCACQQLETLRKYL